MGRTACTEPQCLYKGDLYLYFNVFNVREILRGCAELFEAKRQSV